MHDDEKLAREIADRLGSLDGVTAVAWDEGLTLGAFEREADIRLLLFYRDEAPPELGAFRTLAEAYHPDLPEHAIQDFWAEGPVLNGGGWLWAEGRRVEWRYRELGQLEKMIEMGVRGEIVVQPEPGYVNAFYGHYRMGEVASAEPLHDPEGILSKLRERTQPFPEPLRRQLIDTFMHEADLLLHGAQRASIEPELLYATGCLHRTVGCLVQVLFAVNRQYLTGERGVLEALMRLPFRPDHFDRVATGILASPGAWPDQLQESTADLRALYTTVELDYVRAQD